MPSLPPPPPRARRTEHGIARLNVASRPAASDEEYLRHVWHRAHRHTPGPSLFFCSARSTRQALATFLYSLQTPLRPRRGSLGGGMPVQASRLTPLAALERGISPDHLMGPSAMSWRLYRKLTGRINFPKKTGSDLNFPPQKVCYLSLHLFLKNLFLHDADGGQCINLRQATGHPHHDMVCRLYTGAIRWACHVAVCQALAAGRCFHPSSQGIRVLPAALRTPYH
jgi:hypothetical protein